MTFILSLIKISLVFLAMFKGTRILNAIEKEGVGFMNMTKSKQVVIDLIWFIGFVLLLWILI